MKNVTSSSFFWRLESGGPGSELGGGGEGGAAPPVYGAERVEASAGIMRKVVKRRWNKRSTHELRYACTA